MIKREITGRREEGGRKEVKSEKVLDAEFCYLQVASSKR
jgi:hypothetical protein